MIRVLRAATRASALARWQTDHVAALLASMGFQVEPVVVSTIGDRRLDTPIHEMGGKGVFVTEVQAAVLDGRADIAVHSMKDLPSTPTEGLFLGAVSVRGDPRDAMVGCRLDDLAPGAVVGTGSIRRRTQLASIRPDLRFAELRGNIATRLTKAAGFDAIVMAAVAIERLGLIVEVCDPLAVEVMVPQAGQGALAVECSCDRPDVAAFLAALDHEPSRRVVEAERAFLAELGGDCDLPAGAHATINGEEIVLSSVLASIDGDRVARDERRGTDGPSLGRAAARALLDRV